MINTEIIGLTYDYDLINLENLTKTLQENSIIIEIGAFCGRTTYVFSKNCKKGTKIYSIDTWKTENKNPIQQRVFKEFSIPEDFKLSFSHFQDTLTKYNLQNVIPLEMVSPPEKWENEDYDLIFFDGDHSFKGLAKDIFFWIKHCKPNAIICGHDYGTLNGVTTAVNLVANELKYKLEVLGSIWIFKEINVLSK